MEAFLTKWANARTGSIATSIAHAMTGPLYVDHCYLHNAIMAQNDIRIALLRRAHTLSSLRGAVAGSAGANSRPDNLAWACASVAYQIVASACATIGRQFTLSLSDRIPDDYHVILAFRIIVAMIISGFIDDDDAVDDFFAISYSVRDLLSGRPPDEVERVMTDAMKLARDFLTVDDDGGHAWHRMCAYGIDGYITDDDMSDVLPGGYTELFGGLLSDLLASQDRSDPV